MHKYTQQNKWQYLNDFNRHEDNRNTNKIKKNHDNLTEMPLAFYESLMHIEQIEIDRNIAVQWETTIWETIRK